MITNKILKVSKYFIFFAKSILNLLYNRLILPLIDKMQHFLSEIHFYLTNYKNPTLNQHKK